MRDVSPILHAGTQCGDRTNQVALRYGSGVKHAEMIRQHNPLHSEPARNAKAPQCGAFSLGKMAEAQRFELWGLLHPAVFKTAALNHSATLPFGGA